MAKAASATKSATKKSVPAKKVAAKKVPAKKVVAKKAVAKKVAAAKAPVKTAAAKKAAAKKTVVKTSPAKNPTPKKAPVKSVAKPAAVKSVAKKSLPAKSVSPKGAAPKGASAKKVATTPSAPADKAAKAAPVEVKAAPVPVKSIYAREVVKLPKGAVFCPLSGIVVTPQKSNITPKNLEKLRQLLEEEMTKHTRQANDLRAEADQLASEREQGDTQFDEESGEGDTVSVERERDLLLSASARQTVEEIRAAIERMDAGRYGLCTPAGRRINMARLEAIPWADQCVDCKSARERRR